MCLLWSLFNRAAPDLIRGLWRLEAPDQVRGCDGVGLELRMQWEKAR